MIPGRKRDHPERRRLRESYELVWREREDLLAEVTRLRDELDAERANRETFERRLRNTLVIAENAAEKLREKTRQESEATLRKARARAEEIVGAAEKRRDELLHEADRLERRLAARERAAEYEIKEREAESRRAADALVAEARAEANEIVRSAERRRAQLEQEIERTRAGYRDFLAALERLASEADVRVPPAASEPLRAPVPVPPTRGR